MSIFTKLNIWIFDNVPLPGWLAPWVLGFIVGSKPHRAMHDTTPKDGERG